MKNTSTVVKQFVIDYTCETMDPLMEHEVNGLDYRYVYGNDRLSVNITGVETSSGNLIENGNQIRLYYHMDYLGTADYLTSPVTGKVESWTHYNEWGEITNPLTMVQYIYAIDCPLVYIDVVGERAVCASFADGGGSAKSTGVKAKAKATTTAELRKTSTPKVSAPQAPKKPLKKTMPRFKKLMNTIRNYPVIQKMILMNLLRMYIMKSLDQQLLR